MIQQQTFVTKTGLPTILRKTACVTGCGTVKILSSFYKKCSIDNRFKLYKNQMISVMYNSWFCTLRIHPFLCESLNCVNGGPTMGYSAFLHQVPDIFILIKQMSLFKIIDNFMTNYCMTRYQNTKDKLTSQV